MSLAQRLDMPNLLSLPEDLFSNIGSNLDDQELCSMELANKRFYQCLSSPSRPGPCETRLDIGARFTGNNPPCSSASRWCTLLLLRFLIMFRCVIRPWHPCI